MTTTSKGYVLGRKLLSAVNLTDASSPTVRWGKNHQLTASIYALAKRRSDLFPFVGTDILVDGFPRSANTFMLHALKWSNPEYRYASHMHSSGPLKYAAKKNIPILTLIREPRAAVVSLVVRDNLDLERCLHWYYDYYNCVRDYRNALVLADFTSVTTNLSRVYSEISSSFDLTLNPPPCKAGDFKEVERMVVYSERRFAGGVVDPLKVSLPTREKLDAAPRYQRVIDTSSRLTSLLLRCERVYHELV